TAGYFGYPFGNQFVATNVPFPPASTLLVPPSPTVPIQPPYNNNLYEFSPNFTLPVTYQWSAAIERALGTRQTIVATYIGNTGKKLLTRKRFQILPNFPNLFYTDNGATSSYEALQIQYHRKLDHGLQVYGGYTWAHSIDNTTLDQSMASAVPIKGN